VKLPLLLLTSVLMAGCSLAPTYQKPEVYTPDNFREDGPWRLAKPADQAARGEWWKLLSDEQLNQMEQDLMGGNLDLAIALDRYDAASAILGQQEAAQLPSLDAQGNFLTNRQSAARPLRGANQPNVYGNTAFGAGTTYELDLWGRVRNTVAAGSARAQAALSDVESVRLSLQAQLASRYIELRGLDSEILLLDDSIKAYGQELKLIERRHDEGIVSGIDVARSKTLLEETEVLRQQALAKRALFDHAIALLLGKIPSQFTVKAEPLGLKAPATPSVIPSEVLQRRPDIAAAERRVAAANAEIGVAKAAFYPTFSLSAGGGFQDVGGRNLISTPNSFWTLGPLAFFNVFDGGLRRSLVEQAEARTHEAGDTYRQTVLKAFTEVEDNLSQLKSLEDQDRHQTEAVKAARHTWDLAMNRYREGAVSYLEVVDAENTRLRTERSSLSIQVQRLQATVGLVRAVGGGW
jgi:NodT family efflux transporter outer membrane factor (OMF) lipoprotein